MIIGPRVLLDLTTCPEQAVIFSLVVFGISLINAEKTVAIVPNVPIVQWGAPFKGVLVSL
jgi:hypothetical protein